MSMTLDKLGTMHVACKGDAAWSAAVAIEEKLDGIYEIDWGHALIARHVRAYGENIATGMKEDIAPHLANMKQIAHEVNNLELAAQKVVTILNEPVGSHAYYPSFDELGRDVYPNKLRRIRDALAAALKEVREE